MTKRILHRWSIHIKSKHTGIKVKVGNDQEMVQSKRNSHSKNRGGKKLTNNQVPPILYKPLCLTWVVIFEALFGCHGILFWVKIP